ncbi:MAG: hypothetical protein K2H18_01015 [Muribaculaceae bacterium]|nr:hypothetical protein [Muribaculaceae bacterium]
MGIVVKVVKTQAEESGLEPGKGGLPCHLGGAALTVGNVDYHTQGKERLIIPDIG